MSDESIFREVDEAVRHDQFKAIWDKYGWLILGGAMAIVAGVAGYKGWNYWQAKRAGDAGARFLQALALDEEGKTSEARKAFQDLAADGPSGYRVLARFQLAAATAKAGDKGEAVQAYDGLAANGSVDGLLQGYARIQAAKLKIDEAGYDEMKGRLEPLLAASNPWRFSARELLGLSAYRERKTKEAQDHYTQLITEPEAPPGLKQRAEMMLALIVKADASPDGK